MLCLFFIKKQKNKMGASTGEAKPKIIIQDIDINQIPIEQIKNRELYLNFL